MTTEAAAKCLLLSMDSTIRSNVSVGMPLELLEYKTSSKKTINYKLVKDGDEEYERIKNVWNAYLKDGFKKLANFSWDKTLNFLKE